MALDVGGRHDEAGARLRVAARPGSCRTAAGTRTTSATRCRTARSTRTSPPTSRSACGTTTCRPATTPSCGDVADRRGRDRPRARVPGDHRRDRVAGRRPRRRRAAHRLVEHPPEPALRDRDRRPARRRAARLGAVARRARRSRSRTAPTLFLDKSRWAMDWYYPILGGVLRGQAAQARDRDGLGRVRRRGPRRALRVGPAVDHRGRDVRARHGARRDRRARAGPRAVRLGAVPAARRRRATGAA